MNIEHRSDLYNERAEELCMIGESSSFESNGFIQELYLLIQELGSLPVSIDLKRNISKIKGICKKNNIGQTDLKIRGFFDRFLPGNDFNFQDLKGDVIFRTLRFLSDNEVQRIALQSHHLLDLANQEKIERMNAGEIVWHLGFVNEETLGDWLKIHGSKITSLNLSGLWISDLVRLLEFCPKIKTLATVGCFISSKQLKEIADFAELHPSLEELNLANCRLGISLTEDIVKKLTKIKKLSFYHSRMEIGSNVLKEIFKLEKLESLNLGFNLLGGAKFEGIENLKNLTELNLSSSYMSSREFEEILKIVNLKYLNLSHNELKDARFDGIETLKHLTYLNLSGCSLSKLQLKKIEKLEWLSHVNL